MSETHPELQVGLKALERAGYLSGREGLNMQRAGRGTLWKLKCLLQTLHEARAVGAYHQTWRQLPARWLFVVRGQLQKAVFVEEGVRWWVISFADVVGTWRSDFLPTLVK